MVAVVVEDVLKCTNDEGQQTTRVRSSPCKGASSITPLSPPYEGAECAMTP